ncbi:hypothetical protein CAPTEDRAFT_225049 [Capitella teleta]|uniref:Uncharacterized protein n=1 Tax=Capitella teleta TaxID=283909 RepID=R7TUK4_CAPTE|nr:hypothetical protein CAPTEDRAFT_225049 [Capitella teleta]|eukprot:ELT97339.1 hypothetical protein CAPTEDRAFT_225049 [Capitella teleta]
MSTCEDNECDISGGCLSKGVSKADDSCLICAPAQNKQGWTTIEGCVSSVGNKDEGPLTETELIIVAVAIMLFVLAGLLVIAVICVNKHNRKRNGKESEPRNESASMVSTVDHRLGRRQPMSSHPLYSGYHTNGGFLPRCNGYQDNHGHAIDDWTLDSQGRLPPPRHHAGANLRIGDERIVHEDLNQAPPRDYPPYQNHTDLPPRSHFNEESAQPNPSGFHATRSPYRYDDMLPGNQHWDAATDSWVNDGIKTQQVMTSVFDNSALGLPRSRNEITDERRGSTESVTEIMDFNEIAEEHGRYRNEHTMQRIDI